MSRSQPRQPSGLTEAGSPYFVVNDISQNETCKLKLFPVDTGVPLLLFPEEYSNETETISGRATPFYAVSDGEGNTWIQCRHVMQEADEEKDKQEVRCSEHFQLSPHVNVKGTLVSHCKGKKHWRAKKRSVNVPGTRTMQNFFKTTVSKKALSKKQKTAHKSTTASVSGGDGGEGGGVGGAEASRNGEPKGDDSAIDEDNAMDIDLEEIRVEDMSTDTPSNATEAAEANNDAKPPPPAMKQYACNGITYKDIQNIAINNGYDFASSYPWNIHSPLVQEKFKGSNLCPRVIWNVSTQGNFSSNKCSRLVSRDENKAKEVESTTTVSGQPACEDCIRLQFNIQLQKIMATSISNNYGQLPNELCSSSYIAIRNHQQREERKETRLSSLNDKRKISTLTRRNNDCSRLMTLIQNEDIPSIKRLAIVHFRNGGSLRSFMNQCIQAADYKIVGQASYRRQLVQRSTQQRGGQMDQESFKAILITTLMWKLGGRRLANTFAFTNGGLSIRSIRRHNQGDGVIPNFRLGISCCIDDQGKEMIRKNMDNIFCDNKILAILPKQPCLVSIIVDGVAIEECLNLDDSQLPHQITGLCRHCIDTNFNTYDDAIRVEAGLNNGEIHLAKEAEVFVIAFNSAEFTSVLPICISPTCKKDDVIGESTITVKEILSTILDQWKSYPPELLAKYIMSTVASDGAAAFRKGVGEICNKDLSPAIHSVYDSVCKLFNLTAVTGDIVPTCDNDHLLKRLRGRVKCAKGITIGSYNFAKTNIATILGNLDIVSSAEEAERLFHPDDLMDVLETVKCIHAIGRLADIEFHEYPAEWRAETGSRQQQKELQLLGAVMKLACAVIVGHENDIQTEGNHFSVSEYLTALSKLGHLLFFLFRRNRTEFIPAQNYRNWQEMIRNMFVCVTKAKASDVSDFFWFLNTSKRIEEFFGIMRSFKGGDLNFDALDLRNRAADATLCNWIYSLHPEWDVPSRRLKTCADRKNVRSWKGDTKVANVNEVTCWNAGRDAALEILRRSGLFDKDDLNIDAIIKMEPGVDMLRPYATTIGVLAGDLAEDDDDEEEES